MKKSRKYVDIGTYILMGFMVGAFIGSAMINITLWAGTGMCVGILIGSLIEIKNKEIASR